MFEVLPLLPTDLALFSPEDIVPGIARMSLGYFADSADRGNGNGICRNGDVIDALCEVVTPVLEGEYIIGEYFLLGEVSLYPAICSNTFGERGVPSVVGGLGS